LLESENLNVESDNIVFGFAGLRADFLRKSVQRYFRSQGFEAFFPKGGIHINISRVIEEATRLYPQRDQ